jgi:PST family polysaccharide transporter
VSAADGPRPVAAGVVPYAASGWTDADAALRLLALASAPYDAFVWRDPARAHEVARRLWDAGAGEVAPDTSHLLVEGGTLVGAMSALPGPLLVRRRLQAALALTRGGAALSPRGARAGARRVGHDAEAAARRLLPRAPRGRRGGPRDGRGRRLLAAFFDAARAAGAERCVLEVATDNTPAVRLYERGGFVAYSRPWQTPTGRRSGSPGWPRPSPPSRRARMREPSAGSAVAPPNDPAKDAADIAPAAPGGPAGGAEVPPAAAAESAQAARGVLDGQLVSGVAWTGAVRWAVQIVSWPVTLLTAKLLSPSDYGLLATLGVFTRFVSLITEGGFGTVIVSGAELSPRHLRQLNSLAVLVAAAAFLLSCAMALPVARFARDPAAAQVVIAVSTILVLDAAILVPAARLRRSLRFRELVLVEAVRNVTEIFVTLGLAYLGWRYWSLIGGALAGVLVQTAGLLSKAATGFERPVLAELKTTLRASLQVVSSRGGEFLSTNSDRLIGGRLLGSAALGEYTFASTLAWAPAEKISSMVTRVTPALFGRVRGDAAEMRRYLLNITEAVTLVTMPIFVGLAVVADDAIDLALGPKWAGMVGPLRFFCLAAAFSEAFIAVPHALQAAGRYKALAQNGIASLVLYPPAFLLLAARFGATGMALAWAVIGPALSARLLRVLSAELDLPLRRYARALAPAVTSSALMAAAVLAARAGLSRAGVGTGARLACSIAVGAAAYALCAWTLHNARVRAVIDFARRQRAAARSGAA